MKESTIIVPTPDGDMSAFVVVPQDMAVAPGVLIYMDVFGPRRELRDIARRFASCGYLAVLPQLFHRLGSPVFAPANRAEDAVAEEAQRANLATSLQMSSSDTGAIIAQASSGAFGIVPGLWGAIGYCMGGRHAVAAAASHPAHVQAAVSVHGGRLVDGTGASPHLLVQATTAPLHFAFARDDHTCPPEHQDLIERLAAGTGGRVSVERMDAEHGWSFPERWCFDRHASDRVWERALGLFRQVLWTSHAPRAPFR